MINKFKYINNNSWGSKKLKRDREIIKKRIVLNYLKLLGTDGDRNQYKLYF